MTKMFGHAVQKRLKKETRDEVNFRAYPGVCVDGRTAGISSFCCRAVPGCGGEGTYAE